jgi:DNA-binding protein Fis
VKKLVQGLLIITVLAVSFTGCRQAPKQDEDRTKADAEMFDPATIRDDVVKLIQQAPRTNDVFDFLNRTGAAYIFDMTVPFAVAEQHETSSQQSLVLGAFLSDAMYASAYNRMDAMRQTVDIANGLAGRLGLQNELELTTANLEKIRETDDQEAREALIEEMLDQAQKEYAGSDMADVYALVLVGANVEALYLLSHLTLFASDNQAMIDFMLERADMAQTVYNLLMLMTDEVYLELNPRIQGYYDGAMEIANFFRDVDTLTMTELEEVSLMIESLRNDMFDIE